MPASRDLRPLLAVALLGIVVAAAESVTGLDTGLLLLSPALVLLLPLVAGRYLGEEQLERLVARRATPRRDRPVSAPLPRRRPRAVVVRGGRLLASALAERGPPLTVA
ncbi:MAG TPA: hypothetical protein VK501_16755 [Baekduia sp.]|uniref:hypothetical protein n=1 Tax=Baekduia sp. TaxID=2600305 RepID=UPI002C761B96|nr:hypothetical protein [Baekduia sp.]HMJ35561.1 hypothetical protein [Baekduia sp.]